MGYGKGKLRPAVPYSLSFLPEFVPAPPFHTTVAHRAVSNGKAREEEENVVQDSSRPSPSAAVAPRAVSSGKAREESTITDDGQKGKARTCKRLP